MKTKNLVLIHLPNGKSYAMVNKNENDTVEDYEIDAIRKLFGEAENISVLTIDKKTLKKEVLVLWGQILKNSYITVSRE